MENYIIITKKIKQNGIECLTEKFNISSSCTFIITVVPNITVRAVSNFVLYVNKLLDIISIY